MEEGRALWHVDGAPLVTTRSTVRGGISSPSMTHCGGSKKNETFGSQLKGIYLDEENWNGGGREDD